MISHFYLPGRCLEVAKELLKRFLVGIENFPAYVLLSNLLIEVDNWTGFLWHLPDQRGRISGRAKARVGGGADGRRNEPGAAKDGRVLRV